MSRPRRGPGPDLAALRVRAAVPRQKNARDWASHRTYTAPADGTHAAATAALDGLGKGYGTGMPPKDGVKPMPWTDGVQTLTGMGDPNG